MTVVVAFAQTDCSRSDSDDDVSLDQCLDLDNYNYYNPYYDYKDVSQDEEVEPPMFSTNEDEMPIMSTMKEAEFP